jgi:hypothetical protein
MKFEKVDLFCPKCGKYSVYKDPTDYECENYTERHACKSCLHTWFLGDIEHDPGVFNPKPIQSGRFKIISDSFMIEHWRKKLLEDVTLMSGSQWDKMEGVSLIKVNEPFKIPTYEGDMKDLEVKIGDGKPIGQSKITLDKHSI